MNKQELQMGNIVLPNVYEPRRSDTITIQTINKDKRIQELKAEIARLKELILTKDEVRLIIRALKNESMALYGNVNPSAPIFTKLQKIAGEK